MFGSLGSRQRTGDNDAGRDGSPVDYGDSVCYDHREHYRPDLPPGGGKEEERGLRASVEELESFCRLHPFIFDIIFFAGGVRLRSYGAA